MNTVRIYPLKRESEPITRGRSASDSGRSRGLVVPYPITGTGTRAGGAIAGVGQFAALERKTPATYALGEPPLEPFQLFDPGVDAGAPPRRETRPVAPPRHTLCGKFVQVGSDLLEAETNPLGEDDE